jgi:1,2-dihydroxy-3-keto-5-methylthiopentene dioxygenase
MSSLSVHHQSSPEMPDKRLNHTEDIVATLARVGVTLEHRVLASKLRPGMPAEEILEAVAGPLARVQQDYGLDQVELISLERNPWSEDPQPRPDAPAELLSGGLQVVLFLAGQAQLSLHLGDYLYVLIGEPHDLLVLPAGSRYWLEFGSAARCIVALLRATADCSGVPSGDPIASQFACLLD